MKNHPKSTHKLLKELQSYWEKTRIPKEIQTIYLESFESLSKSKLHNFLISEIESYKTSSSSILLCLNSILTREESISSIKRLNSSLMRMKNWILLEEVIIECAEIFEAYRNITIEMSSNFLNWKKQMKESLNSVNLDIFYEGKSYIGSMENVLDFLLESQFSRVFHFVASDPFLTKCSKITETSQNYLSYRNQYFLTISESTYFKVLEIEKQVFHQPVSLESPNKITLKKIEVQERETEKNSSTPVRTSSQKRFQFKEKGSKNLSNKSINLKKSGFRFIDKVLEEYYSKKETDSRAHINSPQDRSSHSRIHKKPADDLTSEPAHTKKDLNKHQQPEDYLAGSSHESKGNLLKKKLPPLVNPRLKEPRSPAVKPTELVSEDTETRNFLSVERMVEKQQLTEELFASIFKTFLKKTDLYTLANELLSNARHENLTQLKNEINSKTAQEITEELIEFYLKCCNLEGLVEEVIFLSIENSKIVAKLAENFRLTEYFFSEILEIYLKSLNFEEIIEECINLILETHKNAILALRKVQNSSEKKINHFACLLIDELLLEIISQEIVPASINELKQDQEFDSLSSSKILQTFFPERSSLGPGITFDLFSVSQFSETRQDPRESSKEMLEVGSRVVLISSLLDSNSDLFTSLGKNRLQKDLVELLKIYAALPENEKPVSGKKFSLTLEVPYKSLMIRSEKFFFLRSVTQVVRNSSTTFEVLTKDRNFSLFFIHGAGLIKELENEFHSFKFDLFSKVEAIFSQDFSSRDSRSDVLVPFFRKSVTWRVSWIEGLELSETCHLKSCIESIFLNFSSESSEFCKTVPNLEPLEPPFIYGKTQAGLLHNKLFSSLKIPLVVSLILSEDIVRN